MQERADGLGHLVPQAVVVMHRCRFLFRGCFTVQAKSRVRTQPFLLRSFHHIMITAWHWAALYRCRVFSHHTHMHTTIAAIEQNRACLASAKKTCRRWKLWAWEGGAAAQTPSVRKITAHDVFT